jgi:hypothetical protein
MNQSKERCPSGLWWRCFVAGSLPAPPRSQRAAGDASTGRDQFEDLPLAIDPLALHIREARGPAHEEFKVYF